MIGIEQKTIKELSEMRQNLRKQCNRYFPGSSEWKRVKNDLSMVAKQLNKLQNNGRD